MEISPLLHKQSEDMTKDVWIRLVKSMFGGNSIPPSFFRHYQMELFLLASYMDNNLSKFEDLHHIHKELRLQLRVLYDALDTMSQLHGLGLQLDEPVFIWYKNQS
jgi:hypothetical protein